MGCFFTGEQHLAILVDTLSIPSTIIKLLGAAAADFSLVVPASDSVADSITWLKLVCSVLMSSANHLRISSLWMEPSPIQKSMCSNSWFFFNRDSFSIRPSLISLFKFKLWARNSLSSISMPSFFLISRFFSCKACLILFLAWRVLTNSSHSLRGSCLDEVSISTSSPLFKELSRLVIIPLAFAAIVRLPTSVWIA